MPVDKDQPHSWVKFKPSLCRTCIGTCCTIPVEVKVTDLIRLELTTVDEVDAGVSKLVSRLKKQGIVKSYRTSTGLFMLTDRPNGECLYLDPQSRLCKVYDRRPDVCRRFPETLSLRPGYCPAIARALR
jgi:Fe-S-cluster containining protein